MKISKRQLKRIIREEYSKLRHQGLIREMRNGMPHPGRGSEADPDVISVMFDVGQDDYIEGQYGDSLPPDASPEMKEAYDDGYAYAKHEDTYADNYEPEDYLFPQRGSIRVTPMDESRILRAVRRKIRR